MSAFKFKLQKKALAREWFNKAALVQTDRLISYAKDEIFRIGEDISVAPTRNGLDRTGNLLDSLCWAVYYKGALKGHGYYRSPEAIEDSNLHEYTKPMGMSVNGRFMASQFVAEHKASRTGWELFFAIAAPYWGYWEKGFEHPSGRQFQWFVMTSHYDHVKQDLAPMNVKFKVWIPS